MREEVWPGRREGAACGDDACGVHREGPTLECKANTARRRALLTNMLQEAPLLNASPLQLLEAPPRRRCCPPKYSCCCVLLTVLAALLVGAAAGGGLAATVLMQLAATPGSPDLPPASSCCAPTAGGLTGRFIGNVSATKTVLGS